MTIGNALKDLPVNPSQRLPCMLVLDCSDSMNEKGPDGKSRIQELNEGLLVLENELKQDELAARRVQLAIICVGGVAQGAELMLDWTDAAAFSAFELQASGQTPLGKGMEIALDLVEQQKRAYDAHGINYYRPWIMIITDGAPSDNAEWERACAKSRQAERDRKCVIYPIGVSGANLKVLQQASSTEAKMVRGLAFKELFVWFSRSVGMVARSNSGDTVQLPSTDAWRAVQS